MPRPISTGRLDSTSSPATSGDSEPLPLIDPAERLHRWAALVAVGSTPLTEDLRPEELKLVLAEVARLRRQRLVRFIARAIAHDIHAGREP